MHIVTNFRSEIKHYLLSPFFILVFRNDWEKKNVMLRFK